MNAQELTPHKGEVIFASQRSFADGKTVVVTSNQKGGYQNAALLDIASKK